LGHIKRKLSWWLIPIKDAAYMNDGRVRYSGAIYVPGFVTDGFAIIQDGCKVCLTRKVGRSTIYTWDSYGRVFDIRKPGSIEQVTAAVINRVLSRFWIIYLLGTFVLGIVVTEIILRFSK
jgi:hypothetical protein